MERKTKGGVILPGNVAGLREVRFHCNVCGADFYEDEERQWVRHVGQCVNRHEVEIHEASPRTKAPGFLDPEYGDREYERWVRENPQKWARERGIDL
jgi:hypothetical protein